MPMARLAPCLMLACVGVRPPAADTGSEAADPGFGRGAPSPGVLWVADTGNGRVLALDNLSGAERGELCLADVLPDRCTGTRPEDGSARCLLFGVSLADDGRVQLAYGQNDADISGAPGGVLGVQLVDGQPVLEWEVRGLSFPGEPTLDAACEGAETGACVLDMPHTFTWTAAGDVFVASDTLNERVVWVAPDPDGGRAVVRQVLDDAVAGWAPHTWPNAAQLVQVGAQSFALVTMKGSDTQAGGQRNEGRILLWDITDASAPELVWRFPETGGLAAVHHASMVEHPTHGALLLYAHSMGAGGGWTAGDALGSVGVARFSTQQAPTYLADLVVQPSTGDRFGFLREAELMAAGDRLMVTDSGCENPLQSDCARLPRVVELGFVLPPETGLGGSFSPGHEDQILVKAPLLATPIRDTVVFPFEADLSSAEVPALGQCGANQAAGPGSPP